MIRIMCVWEDVCACVCVCWHTLNPEMCLSLSCLTEVRAVEVLLCQTARHGGSTESMGERESGVRQQPPTTIWTFTVSAAQVVTKTENSPGNFHFLTRSGEVFTWTSNWVQLLQFVTLLLCFQPAWCPHQSYTLNSKRWEHLWCQTHFWEAVFNTGVFTLIDSLIHYWCQYWHYKADWIKGEFCRSLSLSFFS